MKEVRQSFQGLTELREVCSQGKPFGELAGLGEKFFAENTELLPVLEGLLVGVVARGDEQVIHLVLAVAEAVLGHVVHRVHHLEQGYNYNRLNFM